MNRHVLIAILALIWVAAFAPPAQAQDVTADVKTWSGQSWRLAQPSLELFYSIVAKPQEAGGEKGSEAGRATNFTSLTLGGLNRESIDPSVATLNRLFGKSAPDTIQGHRQGQEITAYRGGVATQIPLASISSISFKRQPVRDSSLPPYVAATHIRYAADIALVDGGRIDADYINLGTAILRGTTPDGRMDIPWQDIEVLRFAR
ncbi:MAG: hypothetical protein ACREMO_08815 [Gemmatimonadales bacterium]